MNQPHVWTSRTAWMTNYEFVTVFQPATAIEVELFKRLTAAVKGGEEAACSEYEARCEIGRLKEELKQANAELSGPIKQVKDMRGSFDFMQDELSQLSAEADEF